MRILHISSARSWRGGERQIQFLVSGQSENGHKVFMMCPSKTPLLERCKSQICEHVVFRNGAVGILRNMISLVIFCKREQIDIIHAHDSHSHTLVWLCYEASLLKTKSVITRRLDNPIKDNSVRKYNHPAISRIICVSDAVKARMAPQISVIERLVTIHSGIDLSHISKAERKWPEKEIRIGYIAAFTEEKNHELFVNVALRLLKERDDVKFLLVGDGPLLPHIKSLVESYSDNFEFTGFVRDIDKQYAKIDLLLHTASAEALGTSILDGMKFGLPIVANDVGGISEIVQHEQNGYLVQHKNEAQMAEYVLDILNEGEKYSLMSANSKTLVLSFEKSEMVIKTMDLYTDVVEM